MKKISVIIILAAMLAACSTIESVLPQQKIEVSVPSGLGPADTIYLSEINFVREGILTLKDQDEIWFEETELPAMLIVLGEKQKLNIVSNLTDPAEPSDGVTLRIELHEMKKEGTLPAKNSITVICSLENNGTGSRGRIVFVDVSNHSILNSNYSLKVFRKLVKKIAGAM